MYVNLMLERMPPTIDARRVVDRLGLRAPGDTVRVSGAAVPAALLDEMTPFLRSVGSLSASPTVRSRSLLRSRRTSTPEGDARVQGPARRVIQFWNGESVRIEVFADHYSWLWTSPWESPRLADIFSADLTKVAAMPSEAAFSTASDDYEVAPSKLPQFLRANSDVHWFRVNLESESFVWIAPDGLGDDRLKNFAVISDRLDFRLIAGLMVKTATVLVRASMRDYLSDLSFVGRHGPGVSIRKPSLLESFLQLDSPVGAEEFALP